MPEPKESINMAWLKCKVRVEKMSKNGFPISGQQKTTVLLTEIASYYVDVDAEEKDKPEYCSLILKSGKVMPINLTVDQLDKILTTKNGGEEYDYEKGQAVGCTSECRHP